LTTGAALITSSLAASPKRPWFLPIQAGSRMLGRIAAWLPRNARILRWYPFSAWLPNSSHGRRGRVWRRSRTACRRADPAGAALAGILGVSVIDPLAVPLTLLGQSPNPPGSGPQATSFPSSPAAPAGRCRESLRPLQCDRVCSPDHQPKPGPSARSSALPPPDGGAAMWRWTTSSHPPRASRR